MSVCVDVDIDMFSDEDVLHAAENICQMKHGTLKRGCKLHDRSGDPVVRLRFIDFEGLYRAAQDKDGYRLLTVVRDALGLDAADPPIYSFASESP